jgi:hypothetical protein
MCSPDLHTNGTLPYWTICTIRFDVLTLMSLGLGAFDRPEFKKFLCWFSFVPMLIVKGFAISGKVAWEAWDTGAAPEGPVERLVAPLSAKKNELLMIIFWLKLGAAAIKAVSAVMLLCWKEGDDLAEQWIPTVRRTNQEDQTWIDDKILDAVIEEARNRKFKGEPTVVGARNHFDDASLADTEIGHVNGTGRGSQA